MMELKQFSDLLFYGKLEPQKSDKWKNRQEEEHSSYGTEKIFLNNESEYTFRTIQKKDSIFDKMPEKYINKSITVDNDYKIHIVVINTNPHKNGDDSTYYRSIHYCKYIFKAIVIEYRGLFYPAFNLTHYLGTLIYDVHEKCWNNVYISGKLTKEKHHFVKSFSDQLDWEDYITDNIDLTNIIYTAEECGLNITDTIFTTEISTKTYNYSSHALWDAIGRLNNPDFEYFVALETSEKKGVKIYKPERATIKLIYRGTTADRSILQKLGINQVLLRNDAAFSIHLYYDLKDIEVKASVKVIERYSGIKPYVKDNKVKKELVAKEAEDARLRKEQEYNEQFTLSFHGKEILKDVPYSKIIEYLENYESTSTMDTLVTAAKTLFKQFPHIKLFNIGYYGTYFKYECAGEKCEMSDDYTRYNDHISKEDMEKICEEDLIPCLSTEQAELVFGEVERGQLMISLQNKKGEYVITSYYDCE